METKKNSEQSWISYSEKIMRLLRATRKEFGEYSLEKSKQYGFTGPQLFLIFILYKTPGINLQELSERLELSKSTVSGIVDRLVSQGDVKREIPKDNRRSVRLFLSPDFLNKYDLVEIKNRYLMDLIKETSMEELDTVIAGLETLHEIIGRNKIRQIDEIKKKD